MTTLTIDRLSSTTHGGDDSIARRTERLLAEVAEHWLDAAIEDAGLPPGLWCVERLNVVVTLDFSRPDRELADTWAAAVVEVLRSALNGDAVTSADTANALVRRVHVKQRAAEAGSPITVVHFGSELRALADLIAGIGLGRLGHAWAWRQAGLLSSGDPEPSHSPAEAIIAAARRFPQHLVTGLSRAIREVGLAPLTRALGTRGWVALATLVWEQIGGFTPSIFDGSADRPNGNRTLATMLHRQSTFAAQLTNSRLRPNRETLVALAVLSVAEQDPGALARADGPRLVEQVAGLLGSEAASDKPLPLDQPTKVWSTSWAGLPFFLAAAEEAGIPELLLADPALADRPLRWIMHALAQRLVPLAEDDPAALVLAGLHPSEPLPTEKAAPPSPSELDSLREYAAHWTTVAMLRLDREDEQLAALELAQRQGVIEGEPGLLEVVLRLDEVNIDVRRAGLDIDPGWLPWLGAIVRYRYE
ncbi:hypothetical protein [Kutzneria sp. NPDC052558]|uniref:hypothetical protein n=1 Tax=Kutzneria sp. NPDC052558 TaxID=3364121 RepID=UPI0037C7115B